jgi:peptide/nickel transport system ATP-binding protein
MALLELTGLGITVADQRPIAGLDLTLDDRAALAIVGRAGSGKTLLALALAGLLPEGATTEGTGLPTKRPGLIGADAETAELARLLDRGVDLLICDEPGRALGPVTQRELLTALLTANRDRGTGLLILTRDFRLPLAMGLDAAILSGGKVIERGPAAGLQDHPQHAATRELIAAGKPRTRTMARPPIGDPLLELQGVGRRFADPASRPWSRKSPLSALENITLSVRKGEAVGILGGAGAGKSVLLQLVAGFGRTSAGELAFDRTPYRGADITREARARISFMFPDPHAAFNPDLAVGLSLTEPMRVEEQLLIDEQADRLVEAVRVVGMAPDVLDHLPGQFTTMELQRLALARALVSRPTLIVLDEPTAKLDPVEQAEFLVLFNRVRSDYGLTVLCGSREFDVLRLIADRILVLGAGHIVEGGKPSELAESAHHPATLALLAARYPEPLPPQALEPAPVVAEPAPVPAPEPEPVVPSIEEPLPEDPPAPAQAAPAPIPEPPAPVLDDNPDKPTESGQVEPAVTDGRSDGTGSIDAPDPEPVGQADDDRAAGHVEGTK